MVTPRNTHHGDNSTTLGAGFADPAAHAVANDPDTRITEFLAALRQPYWSDAACSGMGADLFHDARRKKEALAVCGSCVSMFHCRTEAVADPTLKGVRGGMDENARRNARRNLKAPQGAPVADVEPTTHPSDPAAVVSLYSPPGGS